MEANDGVGELQYGKTLSYSWKWENTSVHMRLVRGPGPDRREDLQITP